MVYALRLCSFLAIMKFSDGMRLCRLRRRCPETRKHHKVALLGVVDCLLPFVNILIEPFGTTVAEVGKEPGSRDGDCIVPSVSLSVTGRSAAKSQILSSSLLGVI
ncbi:hypothetical protein K491DRAFT_9739 [Lophiostoma macrostomum CBS 122681]|uniref:Uncharacterized protein n=1 Tax=Lophiostoma macrostomum CBS 122681 TaxID=1314788 RepID=A0A6A6TVG7_9PLEO|nr:hypothetical protein K491DRAFT_9739 [Lophiostoma macrostomum CBS 122681]